MIEWVEELRASLGEEFGAGPKVMALATVDRDGRPRVRNVVCRRLLEGTGVTLLAASDARSAKNGQVRRHPPAEACFWLPKLRRQYRLLGVAAVIPAEWPTPADGAAVENEHDPRAWRERVWTDMSDAARALFYWPDPGGPRVHDASRFPEAVRTGLPPDTFELIALSPVEVESLDLHAHPHRRRRWHAAGDGTWEAEELNP